jgi:hypothetical protein
VSLLKNIKMKKALLILFSLQIVISFCYSQQKPLPYGNNPSAGKYYNIRGIKMYCEVYGKGKPLLMIHGNGVKPSLILPKSIKLLQ